MKDTEFNLSEMVAKKLYMCHWTFIFVFHRECRSSVEIFKNVVVFAVWLNYLFPRKYFVKTRKTNKTYMFPLTSRKRGGSSNLGNIWVKFYSIYKNLTKEYFVICERSKTVFIQWFTFIISTPFTSHMLRN